MTSWLVAKGPTRRQRSWGWYSWTEAEREAVFLYETPSGDQVKVTNVSMGYEPTNPYGGLVKDAVLVGEVTQYVRIYSESDLRKRAMNQEGKYRGRRQWESRSRNEEEKLLDV